MRPWPVRTWRRVKAVISRYPTMTIVIAITLYAILMILRVEIVAHDVRVEAERSSAAIAAEASARQVAFEQAQAMDEVNRCQDQADARQAVRQTLIDFILSKADPANPDHRIPYTPEEIAASVPLTRTADYIGPNGALAPIVCPPSPTTTTTGAINA